MKNAILSLVTALVTALGASTAGAIEYVTLTTANATKSVNATDLVEVVGTNKNNYGTADSLNLNFADGTSTALLLRGKENGQAFDDMANNVFTGLTSLTLEVEGSTGPLNKPVVTLKITPADEIGAGTRGVIIVLPENATGDYNLVTESSDDLVNWTVFSTEPVDAAQAQHFYRLRLIQVPQP